MVNPPETRESLLQRLADPADHAAWCEFTQIYRPLVYRLARQRGLQDSDAQDLVQRVLISVFGTIGKWEPNPQRGRFRTWLHTVARNAMIDQLRAIRPDAATGGTTALSQLQQTADDQWNETEIDRQTQREIFRWAARAIRDEFAEDTWSAFWQTAVENQHISEVAHQLQKSRGAIYIARSRVMQRLREKIQDYSIEDWPFASAEGELL